MGLPVRIGIGVAIAIDIGSCGLDIEPIPFPIPTLKPPFSAHNRLSLAPIEPLLFFDFYFESGNLYG
jgi:hypothetical protein